MDRLWMVKTPVDPCGLVRKGEIGELDGLITIQVDDPLSICTDHFQEQEDQAAKYFKTKPRTRLENEPIVFNGVIITRDKGDVIKMDQKGNVDKLTIPENEKEFSSKREMAQYVRFKCRPDICAAVQLIAPGAEPITKG